MLHIPECVLEDPDNRVPFRGLVRIPAAPLPPTGPLVRDLVLHARHERVVRVRVNLPDPLVREEVPVELGAPLRPGHRGRRPLPLLDRPERELPPIRRDLTLVPEAVRVDPRVLSADGHARVLFPLEFLEVVVRHATPRMPRAGLRLPWGRDGRKWSPPTSGRAMEPGLTSTYRYVFARTGRSSRPS